NQEEMIEAARRAIDEVDMEIRRVRRIAALDRERAAPGTVAMRPAALLRSAQAIAGARGARRNVAIETRAIGEPPWIATEPYRAEEALTALLCDAVDRSPDNATVALEVEAEGRD